jgi:hypothetical protein
VVRDFRRLERVSMWVCEVRRVSLEVKWVKWGIRGGVVLFVRGRPRRVSRFERRVERVDIFSVSAGEYVNEYVVDYISN